MNTKLNKTEVIEITPEEAADLESSFDAAQYAYTLGKMSEAVRNMTENLRELQELLEESIALEVKSCDT